MIRWTLAILVALAAAGWFALGRPPASFTTTVWVDNRVADWPNTVTAIIGRRVTLNDGRAFDLAGDDPLTPTYLSADLQRAGWRVRVYPDGTLVYPQRREMCGNAHPRGIVIPLWRTPVGEYADGPGYVRVVGTGVAR